ncbi:MAG: hypothetical protein ACFCVE_15075 [Phycisphaerae bacterium]
MLAFHCKVEVSQAPSESGFRPMQPFAAEVNVGFCVAFAGPAGSGGCVDAPAEGGVLTAVADAVARSWWASVTER